MNWQFCTERLLATKPKRVAGHTFHSSVIAGDPGSEKNASHLQSTQRVPSALIVAAELLLKCARGVTMKLAVAVLLAYSSLAFGATSMSIAVQRNAPVQIQSTTHGLSDALEAAVLTNRSGKAIIAYKIGWVSIVDGKARFHQSALMNTPGGIAAGMDQSVPAQGIPINKQAENMTFFVSHVSFADGTKWSADKADLLKQAVHGR